MLAHAIKSRIVTKSISYSCQTPVPSPDFSLGLGVDFVLPLSQQEQQQPHQNIPEGNIVEDLNLAKRLTKPNSCNPPPYLTLLPPPPSDINLALPLQKKISDKIFFRLETFYRQSFSRPKQY